MIERSGQENMLFTDASACFSEGSGEETATTKQPPLRDFFKNPEQTAHQLSPDGKYLAFLAPNEQRRMNVHVQAIGSKDFKRITNETARSIAGYFWKGNDRLLYVKDFGGDENFHVVSIDKAGKDLKDLTPFEKIHARIVDDLEDHPTDILIAHNKRDAKIFDVYRINTVTGDSKVVAENPGNVTEWKTDHDGKLRVAIKIDGVNSSILYRTDETEPFKTILTTNFREKVNPLFFTFDNKKLYTASNRGRDKAAIVVLNPETAKEEEVLFEHPEVDVDDLHYSRRRKLLTAVSYTTWKKKRKFLNNETESIYQVLKSKLPGYEIDLASHNKEEDKFIVATYNDRNRGARYLFDTKTKELSKIADLSPWLNENDLAQMKPISYASRDGLTIHGYLTLPNGKTHKSLSVIIHPHGGPWVRDRWGFNPIVQFLANRGYAVFQPNFRGSTGYGRKFWEISFKQWGKTMQDDVTDGVHWLVKEGIADPKRICIFGGSYGGYATLAGITFTPDLYACAIDFVGVSNLFTFMKTIPPYWMPELEMAYEMIGHPEKDKELLTSASPVFHVDKIKAPLLIAQGAKDPRVNKAESDQIVEALKKRGSHVEYMVKENEGHGFNNEENRFEFYEAMERFLAQHLKQ